MIGNGRFFSFLIIALFTLVQFAHSQTLKCLPGQVAETISQGIMGSALRKPFETCVDIYSSDPVFVSPSIPKDRSEEGSIEIKLANSNDAELGNIETNFYEIAIPSDKLLGLMKEPSVKSTVIIALPNKTRDIRIKKLGYVGSTKWANLCALGKCGWSMAKHLRQQNKTSTRRTKLVEVAFPEVNVFRRPSVNSDIILSLNGGQRASLKESRTDANGDGWIKICGSGWCGWAAQEFFNPAH